MSDPYRLDAGAVRRFFARAAATYDDAAALQAEAGDRLFQRLSLMRTTPRTILDVGAGTGRLSRAMRDRYRNARVVALDFSEPMLRQARRRQPLFRKFACVGGDACTLPIRSRSIDWCLSNLTLAWCEPVDAVFAEIQRVLTPGGLFAFTSLGPDTLRELRTAWNEVDPGPHVHRFIDMHDLGDALVRAGFAEPVLDVERIVLTYADASQLFRELKHTGLATATAGRVRHLGTRQMLRTLVNAYEGWRVKGRLPATFEIVYGQAWCPLESRAKHTPGEVVISIGKIGRR